MKRIWLTRATYSAFQGGGAMDLPYCSQKVRPDYISFGLLDQDLVKAYIDSQKFPWGMAELGPDVSLYSYHLPSV